MTQSANTIIADRRYLNHNRFYKSAKWYLNKGFSVIPLKPNSKEPLIPWTEYQMRLPTEQELKEWWTQYPDANIGIVTGRISGICVLEVDDQDALNGKHIPITPQAISGGKESPHIYFSYPEAGMNNYKCHEDGTERFSIRGDGQYIVAPPSVHPSGRVYKWLSGIGIHEVELSECPDWVIDLIVFDPAREKAGRQYHDHYEKHEEPLRKYIEELKANIRLSDLLVHLGIEKTEQKTNYVQFNCPFHKSEGKKSLTCWDDIGIARDWHNDENYDAIELVKVFKNTDFREAINLMSDYAGIARYNFSEQSPGRVKISWPQPIAEAAFHGIVGEVVGTIGPHSEADPVALLINFLTAFGSLIGNRPFFRVGADKHRMRLFFVLVGETSKARKGFSWGYIKYFFEILDSDWAGNIQTGLSSGEGLIWAVRDEIRRKRPVRQSGRVVDYEEVVEEEGVVDKRLLVLESEFAQTLRMLGRDGNVLSPVIRNAWDSGDLQTLTKNSPAKATGAHISIIGHIGRDELLRYLTSTEAGNGFGNRFLWFCVKRSKPLPFGGEFHKVNLQPLISKFKEAVIFASAQEEITWAEETKPLWEAVYPKLSEGKPGLIGALTARAEAYVTRLACIYALLDKSDEIKPEHLKAALAVWDYAEASVRYIFQNRIGDPLADLFYTALSTNPNGVARTELYNLAGKHKKSEEISKALERLEALGIARMERMPTEGRDKEIWFLN